MPNTNNEIVLEGWLTKSPPVKGIWKARWRRRWFVLKHSGELPGQFLLLYYTDKNCQKLKGTIDLDQCEQVDAGLRFENSKQNYPHMFDVKTPNRTYYLAAESEIDMNKWVDCVCQVCGLRAINDDTSVEFIEENSELQSESQMDGTRSRRSLKKDTERNHVSYREDAQLSEYPPISPTCSVSGPYIPISECHSGKPLNTPKGISDFNNINSKQDKTKIGGKQTYNKMILARSNIMKQTICADDISKSKTNKPVALPLPVQSKPPVVERLNSLYDERNNVKRREDKITNIESAMKMAEMRRDATSDEFYDSPRKVVAEDEWQRPVPPASAPAPNWETYPQNEEPDFSPGDIGSWSVKERGGKLQVVDSKWPIVTNSLNRASRQQNRQPDTYSLRRPVAPPRPPKPQHLSNETVRGEDSATPPTPSPTAISQPISEETYDVPRSHQPSTSTPNTYCNAVPSQMQGNVFRYDFGENDPLQASASGEPISPRSETCGVVYSNLPSPLVTTPGAPPAVNRELKPTRKMSDSGASSEPSPGPYTPSLGAITPSTGPPSAEQSPLGFGPPSVDRTLKPKKTAIEGASSFHLMSRPPDGSLGMRRVRAGPSPTLPGMVTNKRGGRSRSDHSSGGEDRSPDREQIYFYERNNSMHSQMQPHIQYLDLDMDSEMDGPLTTPPGSSTSATCPSSSATPYKTIDFVKTEAFNRTREEVEVKRSMQ